MSDDYVKRKATSEDAKINQKVKVGTEYWFIPLRSGETLAFDGSTTEKAIKETVERLNEKPELEPKQVPIIVARINKEAQIESAKRTEEGQVAAAKQNTIGQVEVAKITTNPYVLDTNEITVLELAKKLNFFDNKYTNDTKAFEDAINNSKDSKVRLDALNLEKALQANGKDLTVDGVITDKTIYSIKAIIGENLPAIKAYQQLTGEILVPTATPTVGESNSKQK